MKKWLLLVFILVISGCAQQKIVDDVSLIRGVSYDKSEDKNILIKVAVPIFKSEKSTAVDFYTSVADTSKGGKFKINLESPRAFVSGQLAVALYGKSLAEDGVIDYIDTLHRDPSIGNRIKLGVVEGEASDLLSEELVKVGMRPGAYLANLIEQNEQVETLPKTNLHIFLYSYYSDGKDPILPLIKKDKQHAEISGLALFKDDQYVEKIPMKKAYILRLFSNEGFRSGTFEVILDNEKEEEEKDKEETQDEDHIAVIENVKSSMRLDIIKEESIPTFVFKVQIKGLIKEYTGHLNTENEKRLKKIKKELEEKIVTESIETIKQLQKLEIDPIGLGEKYRSTTRDWNPDQWEDLYPQVKIKVEANVTIVQSGVVE